MGDVEPRIQEIRLNGSNIKKQNTLIKLNMNKMNHKEEMKSKAGFLTRMT